MTYSVLYVVIYWVIYRIKKGKEDQMFFEIRDISVSPEHASLTISFLKQVSFSYLIHKVLRLVVHRLQTADIVKLSNFIH